MAAAAALRFYRPPCLALDTIQFTTILYVLLGRASSFFASPAAHPSAAATSCARRFIIIVAVSLSTIIIILLDSPFARRGGHRNNSSFRYYGPAHNTTTARVFLLCRDDLHLIGDHSYSVKVNRIIDPSNRIAATNKIHQPNRNLRKHGLQFPYRFMYCYPNDRKVLPHHRRRSVHT